MASATHAAIYRRTHGYPLALALFAEVVMADDFETAVLRGSRNLPFIDLWQRDPRG